MRRETEYKVNVFIELEIIQIVSRGRIVGRLVESKIVIVTVKARKKSL